jgi:hypothetical protein
MSFIYAVDLVVSRTFFDQNFKTCKLRPPLLSSGQSSWLQIQMSRVRFPELPDFLKAVGLERGPLSLVRIIKELHE